MRALHPCHNHMNYTSRVELGVVVASHPGNRSYYVFPQSPDGRIGSQRVPEVLAVDDWFSEREALQKVGVPCRYLMMADDSSTISAYCARRLF
eukprot:scaffold45439_cov16-Prasinocladus_malaysianus.AAC.1